jgi:hypothetical protein
MPTVAVLKTAANELNKAYCKKHCISLSLSKPKLIERINEVSHELGKAKPYEPMSANPKKTKKPKNKEAGSGGGVQRPSSGDSAASKKKKLRAFLSGQRAPPKKAANVDEYDEDHIHPRDWGTEGTWVAPNRFQYASKDAGPPKKAAKVAGGQAARKAAGGGVAPKAAKGGSGGVGMGLGMGGGGMAARLAAPPKKTASKAAPKKVAGGGSAATPDRPKSIYTKDKNGKSRMQLGAAQPLGAAAYNSEFAQGPPPKQSKAPKPPSSAPTSAKKAFKGLEVDDPENFLMVARKRKSGKGKGRPKVSSRKLFGGKVDLQDLQDHRGFDENGNWIDSDSGTDESEDLSDDDGFRDGKKLTKNKGQWESTEGGFYSKSALEERLLKGKEYIPMPSIPASQFHGYVDEGKFDEDVYDARAAAHKQAMKNERAAKAAAKKQKTK